MRPPRDPRPAPPLPLRRRLGAPGRPRPSGRGNPGRAERGWGPGARAVRGCQGQRSRAGRRAGRAEPARRRAAPCAAHSFVELAVAADLPGVSQRGPRNGGLGAVG